MFASHSLKSFTAFIFLPSGITGLLQDFWASNALGDIEDVLREIEVLGTLTSGSLNKTAVAGTVRGVIKPEASRNSEA